MSMERASLEWVRTSLGLAHATAALAEQTGNSQQLAAARALLADVRTVSVSGGYFDAVAAADRLLAAVEAIPMSGN